MKRLKILFLFILTVNAVVFAQTDLYSRCEKEKSITSVYISQAMLQMMVNENLDNIDKGAIAMLKDKIDNVLILNAKNAKGVKFLSGLRREFMSNKKREILMRINDPNSDVVIFRFPIGEDKSQFVISVLGKDFATMVVIEGIHTLEDIARISKGMEGIGGVKIHGK